jgi:hypothetical protein
MLKRFPEMPSDWRPTTSPRVKTVISGLSTPSVPPDITNAIRSSTRCGMTELLPELGEPFDRRKAALAKGQISTSPQLFKPGRKTTTAAKIG